MDDHDVLHHLLEIEAEAVALVEDAQAAVDKQRAEGENQHRSRYEERYTQEVAELDVQFEKEMAVIKEDYQRQLDGYRKSLDAMVVHTQEFSALIGQLIL